MLPTNTPSRSIAIHARYATPTLGIFGQRGALTIAALPRPRPQFPHQEAGPTSCACPLDCCRPQRGRAEVKRRGGLIEMEPKWSKMESRGGTSERVHLCFSSPPPCRSAGGALGRDRLRWGKSLGEDQRECGGEGIRRLICLLSSSTGRSAEMDGGR